VRYTLGSLQRFHIQGQGSMRKQHQKQKQEGRAIADPAFDAPVERPTSFPYHVAQ
jgi:hypothetical protein